MSDEPKRSSPWETAMRNVRYTNMTLADHAAEQAAYREWADINIPPGGVGSYEKDYEYQAAFDKWYATQPKHEMVQIRKLEGST